MEIGTWVLVAFLSVALLIFLIVGIVLAVKLCGVADEAKKIIQTSQKIAEKADNMVDTVNGVVDNVKGMTSVGGIVKTFANHVMEAQERRHDEREAAREARAAAKARATEDFIDREAVERAIRRTEAREAEEANPKEPC